MRPGLAGGHRVRAVVDVNVLISGVLSAKGSLGRDPPSQPRRPVRTRDLGDAPGRAQPNAPPSQAAQADPSGEGRPARQLDPRPRNPRPGSGRAPAGRLPRPRRRLPPRPRDRPARVRRDQRPGPARPQRRPADPHARTVRDQAPSESLSNSNGRSPRRPIAHQIGPVPTRALLAKRTSPLPSVCPSSSPWRSAASRRQS